MATDVTGFAYLVVRVRLPTEHGEFFAKSWSNDRDKPTSKLTKLLIKLIKLMEANGWGGDAKAHQRG